MSVQYFAKIQPRRAILTPCGQHSTSFDNEANRDPELVGHWELAEDGHRLGRTFRFANFRTTFTFMHRVGEFGEAEGHHRDIRFGWGYTTVSVQTKKIKESQKNIYIMAAKIDHLADRAIAPAGPSAA